MELIQHRTMDEERALYHLTDGVVEHCTFAGPADGESALKEARNVTVRHCAFSLRYPFWHTEGFTVEYCTLDEGVRASLWYAADGTIRHTTVSGVKCLRECRNISFEHCTVVSEEFGWRCRNVDLSHTAVTSQYFLFETKGGNITDLTLKGKYSFQYTEDLTVTDSFLAQQERHREKLHREGGISGLVFRGTDADQLPYRGYPAVVLLQKSDAGGLHHGGHRSVL